MKTVMQNVETNYNKAERGLLIRIPRPQELVSADLQIQRAEMELQLGR